MQVLPADEQALLKQECALHAATSAQLKAFRLWAKEKNQDFGQCSANAVGVVLQPVAVLTAAGPAHAYLSQALMSSRLVVSGKVILQYLQRGMSNELAFWVPHQPRGGTFIHSAPWDAGILS